MKLTKETARKNVLNCAKVYQNKLLNKQMIIIYRDIKENKIKYIEVTFYARNYQHLTGLELIDKNGNVLYNQSENFFRKCIENKLGLDEIQFKRDGTTPLKIAALSILMDITKITKIIGDYNGMRPFLLADKVIGGVNLCLALAKESASYVPASALLENIKKLTLEPSQVLAIFEKNIGDEMYCNTKHIAKGLNFINLKLPDEISKKLNLDQYIPKE